jgi:hypothetical protein
MQSFQRKIGTCAFLRALSGFQSAFILSKRFISFHGASFHSKALLFYFMALYSSA